MNLIADSRAKIDVEEISLSYAPEMLIELVSLKRITEASRNETVLETEEETLWRIRNMN